MEDLTLDEIVEDLERVSRGEQSKIMSARKLEPDPEEKETQRRWKRACDALYGIYFEHPDKHAVARVERLLNLR
jgi:hypothetical protein